MSRRASALAVALVSLCWQVPVQGVFVKFPVQLALSDNEFFPSGTVYGDIEENPLLFSKLTWDRPEISPSARDVFAASVRSNGFVKIKIPSDFQAKAGSDKFVQGSARSRCLAQSAPDQKLHLYMNFGGSTSAVEYRVSCQAPVSELPAEWSQANQVAVVCRFPETVAPMRLIAQPGLEPGGLPEGSTIYPESQDGAPGAGSDAKKKVPVKDERSWIMKNWIFLIPAGMLLVNILGAGDTAPAARPGQTTAQGSTVAQAPVAGASAQGSGTKSRRKR